MLRRIREFDVGFFYFVFLVVIFYLVMSIFYFIRDWVV